MATYIILAKLTNQGAETVREIPRRRAQAKEFALSLGLNWQDGWLTMGSYDVVFVVDAPDETSVSKFVLQISMQGNLSTQTLRALSESEMDEIVKSL